MLNLKITFAHPWLWLLLIPAVALTLYSYFKVSRKYRRTRNRITSIVMHLIVTLLCVTVLVNTQFSYDVYNNENEILLLVDVSESVEQKKDVRDELVSDIIKSTDSRIFKIGVVTFGYDNKYVAELSSDPYVVLEQYQNAEYNELDFGATNIASAVTFAKGIFTKPKAAKIVIVSDGFETDESALAAVKEAVAEGIRVDTVCLPPTDYSTDVSLVSCETPEFNVVEDEQFSLKLTVSNMSDSTKAFDLILYDNGEKISQERKEVKSGTSVTEIRHSLKGEGLHTLKFEAVFPDGSTESVFKNNDLYAYMLLNKYNDILIIDGYPDGSASIVEILKEEGYETETVCIGSDDVPTTLDELRQYDEIILNNVSNSDLQKHDGLDLLLQKYVYEVGGGLFTAGGQDANDQEEAHAYNRKDMLGSVYQQMLPVQIIDYTPPLGVYVILDISGSMTKYIEATKAAAVTIISDNTCLSERDYCGIMTLNDYAENLTAKPIPVTRQEDIKKAINNISDTAGSTKFQPSIDYACKELLSLHGVGTIEKMHVVLITDGMNQDEAAAQESINRYVESGVSFTFLGVEGYNPDKWQPFVDDGKIKWLECNQTNLTTVLKEDLRAPEIKEVEAKEFTPTLVSGTSYSDLFNQEDMPTLGGYYGSKSRENTMVISGEYNIPVYAEWKYGAGTVGSFMCDLGGQWSSGFISNKTGRQLILAMINKALPTEDIRPQDLRINVREDNYTSNMSIYSISGLKNGEKIEMTAVNTANPDAIFEISAPSLSEGYSRSEIVVKTSGIYAITFTKYSASGEITSEKVIYKEFSYSEEYNHPDETFNAEEFMQKLAESADGQAQSAVLDKYNVDPERVFDGFVKTLHKNFDPRWLFMITAIACFLVDIAVRKFKFKWPHEIIREARQKRAEAQNKG